MDMWSGLKTPTKSRTLDYIGEHYNIPDDIVELIGKEYGKKVIGFCGLEMGLSMMKRFDNPSTRIRQRGTDYMDFCEINRKKNSRGMINRREEEVHYGRTYLGWRKYLVRPKSGLCPRVIVIDNPRQIKIDGTICEVHRRDYSSQPSILLFCRRHNKCDLVEAIKKSGKNFNRNKKKGECWKFMMKNEVSGYDMVVRGCENR